MHAPVVAVTGLGVWSAAGTNPQALFQNALEGRSFASWHPHLPGPVPIARAPDPDLRSFPSWARRLDRSAHLALAAASSAAHHSRLHLLPPHRVAVIVGQSRGPVGLWTNPPPGRLRPTRSAQTAIASLSGALSIALHIRGPSFTVSATCASAAHAIALGATLLHQGTVDAVLAGGAEAPLVPSLLEQFLAAGILGHADEPRLACRPFDLHRTGTLPAEGAAFLVLERLAHAQHRGQTPLACLAGWALAAEAHNRVAPDPQGRTLSDTMLQALAMAGLPREAVGLINAHGTGTLLNDAAEAAACRACFGSAQPPLTSTKPVTGHAFGATAALEALLTIQSLQHQIAPPIATCTHPDPALGLNLILGSPRPLAINHALSLSLGFWGNLAALLFQRVQASP